MEPLTWVNVLLLLLRKMLAWFLEKMLKPHEEYILEIYSGKPTERSHSQSLGWNSVIQRKCIELC